MISFKKLPLRLYLIRHGETKWSVSGRHTSRTDLRLTGHGEQEARTLERRLGSETFIHVFTSPRSRARQTCALAGLASSAENHPDLAEWDYGDYEGRHSAEIRKERPGWDLFQDGCPGGETPSQVAARADRLLYHLRLLSGNIALFSHGQFGCVLAARWIGWSAREGRHFALGTASISILGHDPHHPAIPVIAQWNARMEEPSIASSYPRLVDARPPIQRAIERWENEGGEIPSVEIKPPKSSSDADPSELVEQAIGPSS